VKRRSCCAFLQFSQEFVSKAGWRALPYFFSVPEDGLIRIFFNAEAGSGGMTDDANHSYRILLKSFVGIADGSDDPTVEIGYPAHVVYNGKICDIVKKAVDGDVPSKGILCRRAETLLSHKLALLRFCFFKFRSAPKRGQFDDFPSPEKDVDQSEPASDDAAVSEEIADLMRVGVRGHVEIFRDLSEKQIPYAATDEISQKPVSVKAVEDLECLFIDHFSRNGVLVSWNNDRGHKRSIPMAKELHDPGEDRKNNDRKDHDRKMLLDDWDVSEHVAAEDKQQNPGDPSGDVVDNETSVGHGSDARDKGCKRPYDGNESSKDNRFPSVSLVEPMSAIQVFLV
jgi:hypothetical protein